MSTSRLHELSAHGVSVWIDSLSREMLETGELARLMKEDTVVGVTSNPTIFQKALAEGEWYDDQLREAKQEIDEPVELFFALALEDIRDACDLMRPVWESTAGIDGKRKKKIMKTPWSVNKRLKTSAWKTSPCGVASSTRIKTAMRPPSAKKTVTEMR